MNTEIKDRIKEMIVEHVKIDTMYMYRNSIICPIYISDRILDCNVLSTTKYDEEKLFQIRREEFKYNMKTLEMLEEWKQCDSFNFALKYLYNRY